MHWPVHNTNRAIGVGFSGGDIARLVRNTILQVRNRNFENDVLITFDQRHPPAFVSARTTNSLEFDIDLEVRTVAADIRTLQSSRYPAFGCEYPEENLPCHARA